jgi:hypothetical protein
MNPVMPDANSIAESQQKPGDRPKHHPPREPVLQVIGDLFQPPLRARHRLPLRPR